VLPFKDNLPHGRLPLAILALVALNALAYALSAPRLALIAVLLNIASLALLGPSLEAALGRIRLLAVCALGALHALASDGAAGPLAFAAAGATVAVLAVYLARFPRTRVLSLVPIPFVVTIVEVPATLLLGAWTAAQLYLGLAG
jgi:membrane associated rhomboid family serine protease